MRKETITYTDYNGRTRTEDFYFNISKAEAFEMECSVDGGLSEKMQRLVAAQSLKDIVPIFKSIVLKAYGIKSDDGKRFIKSKEISESFEHTEAYSILFMRLATDLDYASDFLNNVVPNDGNNISVPKAIKTYEEITGTKAE